MIITGVISMIAVAILAGVALAGNPSVPPTAPPVLGTGISYQGFVRDDEQPASGAYDFEFALFNSTSGVQVGATIPKDDLTVVNGLVSTHLDFGTGIFDGTELVMEVRTRKGNQTGAFEVQTPRLPISPVPYAIFANNGPFWGLNGNSGIAPGTNFVGTTDAQPLVFKVNNHEAMRIVPGGTSGDNVGINTTNPLARLHARWADSGATPPSTIRSIIVETNSDADGIALLQNDGKSINITFGSPADNNAGRVLYQTSPDNFMAFWTAGAEKMRIGPTGNVGIGTDAPAVALHVVKENGGEVTQYIGPGDSGGRLKLAYLVGEEVGRVTAHGNGAAQQLQLEGSTIVLNTDEGTGSVGIGTLNPCEGDGSANCLLHVSKSGANRIRIDASSGQQAGLDLRSGNSREIITYDTETGVKFFNGDRGMNDLFIRNSDGFVGINTGSSANAPLEVHGENASGYGAIFTNISTNGNGVLIQATDGNGTVPIFRVEDNSQNAKLVVREDGNVGIGRADPNNKLEVGGRISIRETDDAVLQMVANKGSGSYIQWVEKDVDQRGVLGFAKGSPDLVYQAQSSNINTSNELFRITSDGEVGIGINNPSEKLSVAGVIQSTSGGFKFPDGTVQSTASSGGSVQQTCVISGNDCDFGSRNVITNGRIGIGTGSPSAKLEIESTFGSPFRSVVKAGNGTAGTFVVSQTDGSGSALLASTQGMGRGAEINIQNSSNPNSALYLSTTGSGKALQVVGKSEFFGNVTIGGAGTNYQLNVNGTVKTREVVVSTTGFPDYVFDDDYDLMSLPDLERTILKEGHLPGMPSAEEVAVSGIGLGDMQTRLLEKIEELTLHTIKQDKAINRLQLQTSFAWALVGGLAVIVIFFGMRRLLPAIIAVKRFQ
jgi:hypothetical protein